MRTLALTLKPNSGFGATATTTHRHTLVHHDEPSVLEAADVLHGSVSESQRVSEWSNPPSYPGRAAPTCPPASHAVLMLRGSPAPGCALPSPRSSPLPQSPRHSTRRSLRAATSSAVSSGASATCLSIGVAAEAVRTGRRERRQQREVDGEWLLGELPTPTDLRTQLLRCLLRERRDCAQPARPPTRRRPDSHTRRGACRPG